MESLRKSVSGGEFNESNGCIFWFVSDVENLASQHVLTNYGNLAGLELTDSPRQ